MHFGSCDADAPQVSVATDYLDLLDVPMEPFHVLDPVTTVHADFRTGKNVSVPPSPGFAGYAEQLDKYPFLDYTWDLPTPVPEDLLLPFREFLAKYNLDDVAYSVYFSGPGYANILDQLTVNVFKLIDNSYLKSNSGSGMLPVSGNNGELYDKALDILGSDVLLSTTVVDTKRSYNNSDIRLVVQSGSKRKLIKASKLLITIPPLLSNCKLSPSLKQSPFPIPVPFPKSLLHNRTSTPAKCTRAFCSGSLRP